MENADLFKQSPVFACLSEMEQERLLDQAVVRQYHSGQYLTLAGDIWPFIFFLAEGTVVAIKESMEGRSLVATSFIAGDIFWGVSFFYPELPMPVALRADKQSSAILWPRELILPTILENGRMSWELSRLMVSRMLRASEIVEELAFQPVAGRLAKLLIDFPRQGQTGPIARSLTLDNMAARIGSTREMVCRLLQRFADQEMIKITRTEFEITDRERLVEMIQKVKG